MSNNVDNVDNIIDKQAKRVMFFCEIEDCNKQFKSKRSLRMHNYTHKGERPYICNWKTCGKCFSQYSSLQKHEKIHTNERPYKCQFNGCTLAFTQVSNLKRHIRVHTKEKPYKCNYCSKCFNTTSNLKQHEEIHKVEEERTKFFCQKCDKYYFYISNLRKHEEFHQQQEQLQQINKDLHFRQENKQSFIKKRNKYKRKQQYSLSEYQLEEFNLQQQSLFQNIDQKQLNGNQKIVDSDFLSNISKNFINYTTIIHNQHIDFLIDGRLYLYNGETIKEHQLEESQTNPAACRPFICDSAAHQSKLFIL